MSECPPSEQDLLIAGYEEKVRSKPENELLRFSLGKALFDAGRFKEAEVHLNFALGKRADWMVVVMLLAKCALRREDRKAARAFYEKALDLAIRQKHEDPEQEIREALAEL